MLERIGGVALLVAALHFFSCGNDSKAPSPAAPKKANVLLVTIETLRSDHVGIYGYSRNTTPNLDRLARQGARFRTAIAQAPCASGDGATSGAHTASACHNPRSVASTACHCRRSSASCARPPGVRL